jgi:hypothetical protein
MAAVRRSARKLSMSKSSAGPLASPSTKAALSAAFMMVANRSLSSLRASIEGPG